MKIEQIKLDEKGRIVLPASFRAALSIDEGDFVYISLDESNQKIILSPRPQEKLYLISITMGDSPGTLAKLAQTLANEEVDLIASESHSLLRNKDAVWRVTCKFEGNWERLFERLKKSGATELTKKELG